jgi:hypothetical protein
MSTPQQRETIRVDRIDRLTLQRRLIGAAIALVGAIALGGFNAWYINHVENENRRELCGFIVAMSDAYRARPASAPALTDVGQRIADAVEQLRTRYAC